MDKEKQIEEMARDICKSRFANDTRLCKECENECLYYQIASALNAKGYRKASDVAREIFAEIAKIIQHHDELAERDKSEYGELIVMDIGCAIADLKKKYTEEGK
jgi:DNA integrity scanning protein DisA with diadenylate cyclase activity